VSYTVTLIPGDGIGPEVVAAAVRVLSATGIEFEWETETAGAAAIGEYGSALPERVLESIRATRSRSRGPPRRPSARGTAR
jgi:isocitrate dehydrogenase (NAD+)